MEYIKESNKNLISLRSNLMTVMVVLTGGITGLILSNISLCKFIILFSIGIYFDILFLCNVIEINEKINKI